MDGKMDRQRCVPGGCIKKIKENKANISHEHKIWGGTEMIVFTLWRHKPTNPRRRREQKVS